MLTTVDNVDLTNCDREPIHIPGSIQSHGCLLACDGSVAMVRRHSVNTAAVLGLAGREINGATLDDLIGEQATHDIRNAVARWGNLPRPGLMTNVRLAHSPGLFNIAVHRHQGINIVEFEPANAAETTSPLELSRLLMGRIAQVADINQLFDTGARLLRAALGYDRVMIYRFAPDGAGQVISEAKRGDLESFHGQHFP
ncbi:MAG: hybrid sensor histidine kinase/response regulator, partial [Tardiphaga sp.]|nr:hybrid sensor histidine kinase/response regulator [Tardiphaga sp.]